MDSGDALFHYAAPSTNAPWAWVSMVNACVAFLWDFRVLCVFSSYNMGYISSRYILDISRIFQIMLSFLINFQLHLSYNCFMIHVNENDCVLKKKLSMLLNKFSINMVSEDCCICNINNIIFIIGHHCSLAGRRKTVLPFWDNMLSKHFLLN